MIAVVRGSADVGRWGNPSRSCLNSLQAVAVGSSMAQLAVAGCLGLSGILTQVSLDTEGEFVAKHIQQTQCANFVARLVSHCLLRSFALFD